MRFSAYERGEMEEEHGEQPQHTGEDGKHGLGDVCRQLRLETDEDGGECCINVKKDAIASFSE